MSNNDTDWSGAAVDGSPRKAKIVHSTRINPELSEALEAEAARRGITPSRLINDFVEAGLRQAQESPVVHLRLADLHRVIDDLAGQAKEAAA